MTRLALDTSAVIYLVEGSSSVRRHIYKHIADALAGREGAVLASRLARLECCVKPLRENNLALLDEYDALLRAEGFTLVDVTASVLDRATHLRAHHAFKTPDAIHLATALEARCDVFLTGDVSLAKCPGVHVEVVAP